jgi:hypothetical protein
MRFRYATDGLGLSGSAARPCCLITVETGKPDPYYAKALRTALMVTPWAGDRRDRHRDLETRRIHVDKAYRGNDHPQKFLSGSAAKCAASPVARCVAAPP